MVCGGVALNGYPNPVKDERTRKPTAEEEKVFTTMAANLSKGQDRASVIDISKFSETMWFFKITAYVIC